MRARAVTHIYIRQDWWRRARRCCGWAVARLHFTPPCQSGRAAYQNGCMASRGSVLVHKRAAVDSASPATGSLPVAGAATEINEDALGADTEVLGQPGSDLGQAEGKRRRVSFSDQNNSLEVGPRHSQSFPSLAHAMLTCVAAGASLTTPLVRHTGQCNDTSVCRARFCSGPPGVQLAGTTRRDCAVQAQQWSCGLKPAARRRKAH